jgi:ABC-type multidrug transport system ATPase subunit/pSer/pThr/pTyr-binding forkhead associated (FHA) protein
MTIERAISPGDLPLHVRADGSDRMLQAGPSYRIGRDPESDIVIADSRVSWHHAVLRQGHDYWLLEDSGSTNGTFVGRDRVRQIPITGDCEIRLGHPEDGPTVSCSPGVAEAPAEEQPLDGPGSTAAYTPTYQQPSVQEPVIEQPAVRPTPKPQTPVPQTPVPQTPKPQTPKPQTPKPQTPVPQTPAPQPAGYGNGPGGNGPGGNGPGGNGPGGNGAGYGGSPSGGGAGRGGAGGAGAGGAGAGGAGAGSAGAGAGYDGGLTGGRAISQLPDRPPSAIMSLRTTVLRIGRAADNAVVVPDLGVSRYHAELRRRARGGYEIVDLDSHNGTFLNGQRVTAAPVTEDDLIGVGPATFRLVGEELQEFIDTGDVSLAARDLTVTLPSGRVLLDHVSFPLGERCLLGVIGPSGAGKSTLLGALTGMAPANGGGVLYDNRDLYTHYAELRHRIGLVPQDNILHTQLTAQRALGFAAELRFPPDTSKAERQRRIAEVLEELALTRHAETRTSAMSGGQQKRVNVALELLTKPSLLFLDEPTSGLDPGLDKSVMEQMAELAHDGRTIIVVTHSVANLNLCDRLLVLVPGGKIAYFGPPEDGLRHFGQPGWAEVFQAFEAEPERDWAGDYRRSPYYHRFIAADMEAPAPLAASPQASVAPPASRNRLAQLSTLCRRYMAVIASDKVYLAVLAVMPIILGGLAFGVPVSQGLRGPGNTNAESLLLILVIGACFTGAANSVRELVKERAIYSRERAAGLSAGAYLVSKLIILGVISAFQVLLLVGIGLIGKKLPPTGSFLVHLPLVEILLALGVLAVVSMTLGLLISSLVNSSDKTMPLLVVAVMFQVILTGGIFPLAGKVGIDQVSWISPSRWGFAATASTVNLNVIQQPPGQSAPAGQAAHHGTGHNGSAKSGSAKSGSAKSGSAKSGSAKSGSAKSGSAKSGSKAHHHKGAASSSGSASPTATASPVAATAATSSALPTDPLWDHASSAWLKDVGGMIVLGLLFSLLAWWRILKIKPGRRR